ncbi:LysR family transcriptional regulator [Pandoraea morbifera]|uniref:LysR family transcriptional regulator n=1 Tax=Pandoraea morbifera TaxID=2508300 RepID=A0A5E4XEM7_9BURK|nr:LysR substrate-binding domain-containing protein [Pandoraea morbifera]VVE34743.1 LysR family transcriptional regulator [Pandoraea morbifera]
MPFPNLDMDALRTFVATQQLGSLNRAAERIGRSQSAVSQQMRKLEEQVGHPLFRRQGRGLVLTDAGDMILSYAHRILDLNDEAVLAVRGASIDGVVRFGLPGDFAEAWLPAALGRFKKAHPGVRVEVAVERNGVLLERLDRDELDLALVMDNEHRPDAELLATLPMTWIGSADADEALHSGRALDLALFHPPCFFRRAGIEALDRANISWRLAYTTASLQSLWSGVAAGLGITLRTGAGMPSSLRRLGAQEGLPPLPSVKLCLHGRHQDTSPALVQLKHVVTACVNEHLSL